MTGSEQQAAARSSGGTPAAVRQRVARYYDSTQVLYSHLWSKRGVHYGLWEAGTRRRTEAIRNLDRLVAEQLALHPRRRVLDAGCGVGGTSIFLAERYHLEVVGMTLSLTQLHRARRALQRCTAGVPPAFLLGDYLCTGFRTASFDGVVAVESACYAERKEDFLREAFRLLRPGGRLVVADGFLQQPVRRHERQAYQRLLDGMALANLAAVGEFAAALRRVGFADVRQSDKRLQIIRSARTIEALSYAGLVVCALPCRLGIFPRLWFDHGLAGISQRRLFQNGTVTYRVFAATKPEVRSAPDRPA